MESDGGSDSEPDALTASLLVDVASDDEGATEKTKKQPAPLEKPAFSRQFSLNAGDGSAVPLGSELSISEVFGGQEGEGEFKAVQDEDENDDESSSLLPPSSSSSSPSSPSLSTTALKRTRNSPLTTVGEDRDHGKEEGNREKGTGGRLGGRLGGKVLRVGDGPPAAAARAAGGGGSTSGGRVGNDSAAGGSNIKGPSSSSSSSCKSLRITGFVRPFTLPAARAMVQGLGGTGAELAEVRKGEEEEEEAEIVCLLS
jgi:hypothetical protein